jgi:hypothetical protein
VEGLAYGGASTGEWSEKERGGDQKRRKFAQGGPNLVLGSSSSNQRFSLRFAQEETGGRAFTPTSRGRLRNAPRARLTIGRLSGGCSPEPRGRCSASRCAEAVSRQGWRSTRRTTFGTDMRP